VKEISMSANADPLDRESGFSLIEVMIAIVVLVFGIVAVANLMVVAAASNSTANHSTSAAALAYEEMERLKARRLDLTPIFQPATAVQVMPQVSPFPEPGRPVLTVTTTIQPAGPPGTDGRPISRFMTVTAVASSSIFAPRTTATFTTFRTTND
jgi:prepilin-type N-terminal cleavage/methylation domain-containing protein